MPRQDNTNDGTAGASKPTNGRKTTGNPTSTSRKASGSTKTNNNPSGVDQFPFLKAKPGSGYTWENTWPARYDSAHTLPITAPGTETATSQGAPVQNGSVLRQNRGYMVYSDLGFTRPSDGTGNDTPYYGQRNYKFNFFYNPTEIDLQNSIFTGAYPPGALAADKFFAQSYPATETISWSLLLDRTMDAYQNADTLGTIQDLYALYGVLNGGDTPGDGYNLGYLYMTPVKVVFGATEFKHDIGSVQTPGFYFEYRGYITSIAVTHQRFSQFMIPNLSTVNLTLTRIATTVPQRKGKK